MPTLRSFTRRQVFLLGSAIGLLVGGGGAVTAKAIDSHVVLPNVPQIPEAGPYLHPGAFDQQFLAKSADVKQIWDFAAIEQVQSDGLPPIKNAMNAFQFVYRKTLYPLICLRGTAVIYALDDAMWAKYNPDTAYGQQTDSTISQNPLYHRFTTDNGTLSLEDPNSLYQDSSLQALLQRGSSIAVCYDALHGLAAQLAEQHGLLTDSVFNEFAAHLVSGAKQTPSGSSLIAVAQHLGFTYAKQ